MAILSTPPPQKPSQQTVDTFGKNFGHLTTENQPGFKDLLQAIAKEGALTQKGIEQNYPGIAEITDAFIPQNALSVGMTPVTLAASVSKLPALMKAGTQTFQGLLNAGGQISSGSSSDPSQENLDFDILDQIANEGRMEAGASTDLPAGITTEDLMAMLSSAQPAQQEEPGKIQEFFDRILANLGNRNYDLEQLQMTGAYQDPQTAFMSERLPELLQFFMEQDARAARDMRVAAYEDRLMQDRFQNFPGLTTNPLQ